MSGHHSVAELLSFVEAVLCRFDVPVDDARVTAQRMLEADMRGKAAHGIFRLPQYVSRLGAGGYNTHPDIRIVRESPISALIDGDNGLGHVIVTRAVETAVAKAGRQGLAWVGIRNSNHAGAGGVYASMALEHDMIGIYLAVGSSNHLPPWGGITPLLSTNPLAVAIPAGNEPPVVLDMATTVVSYGQIKLAAERGETLPEGWMVDRAGAPMTDSRQSSEAFLAPIGGYKGYGLGLVIGLLAGVFNGAAFGSQVIDFTTDHASATNTGQTIAMVRADLLRPLAEFLTEMDERVREIRTSERMPEGPPVRIPGEHAVQRVADALLHGIEISHQTEEALRGIAERLGIVDHPFPATQ